MLKYIIFLFILSASLFADTPSKYEIVNWLNTSENFSIKDIKKIKTFSKESAFIASLDFSSRGRCCTPVLVLIMPELKKAMELDKELIYEMKVMDLNKDGVSEIELFGSFGMSGYLEGTRELVYIKDLKAIELYKKSFSDNCGARLDGCIQTEVIWEYKDLDNDNKLEIVESFIEREIIDDVLQSEEKNETIYSYENFELIEGGLP